MQHQTFSTWAVMCYLLHYCEKQSREVWEVYFKSKFISALPSEQPKPLGKNSNPELAKWATVGHHINSALRRYYFT